MSMRSNYESEYNTILDRTIYFKHDTLPTKINPLCKNLPTEKMRKNASLKNTELKKQQE
jgi:hypothetical protein